MTESIAFGWVLRGIPSNTQACLDLLGSLIVFDWSDSLIISISGGNQIISYIFCLDIFTKEEKP